MSKNLDLSLIIACYNEEQILEKKIQKVFSVLDNSGFSYEIIFVDDKSKDGTVKVIKKIIKKNPKKNLSAIYHDKNYGRGKSVADGILKARGRVVGFIDIDLEVVPDYILRFVQAIDKGNDVAVALRIYDFTLRSLPRWIGSKGYIRLRKLLLKDKLNDTEAGFKFFKRNKILPILKNCQDKGWFWDTEIMLRSFNKGLKIIEIPTVFIRDFSKKSTVNIFKDSMDYFKKLMKYKKELKR